jgi:DNA-directed RNA polymerase subunit N (RpoN/RPB10)
MSEKSPQASAHRACFNTGHRVADHFEDYLELVEALPSAGKSIKELERKQQTRVGRRTP